VKNTTPL